MPDVPTPPITKLSVIIPCYNEERTIGTLLQRIRDVDLGPIQKDIVVIDDGSTDASARRVRDYAARHPEIRLIQQSNQGKGAAVRRGLTAVQGDAVVIQDADLEYDPADWHQMLAVLTVPEVSVVFGSRRLLSSNAHSGMFYFAGAQLINFFTNLLYQQRVSDQFTCYKMMRRAVLEKFPLRSNGFEFDAELVAKMFRLGYRVQDVPIHYFPRSRHQGKKIRWRDGLLWLWQIIKYRFLPRHAW